MYTSNINKKDNDEILNNKKILCFNILNKKKCLYGDKCVYAHSLSDQKIEPLRHKAYTIIKSAEDLSNINLIADIKLYETLLQLTKVCSLCNKSQCPGGYNCRNGAINMKSKVCYEDFIYGNCKRANCLATHLTKRGFIPYNKQKNKENINNIKKNEKFYPIDEESLEEISDEIIEDIDQSKNNNVLDKYNYTRKNNTYTYNNNSKFRSRLAAET